MTDQLTQRVAEVIWQAEHDLWDGEAHFNMAAALVYAQAVVAALQLREEQYRSAMCPDDRDYDRVRWASPWVQRVAEVIRAHPESVSQGEAWNKCAYCSHDGDYATHVAEVVVATLQLTPLYTWSWPAELTSSGEAGYGLLCDSFEEAATEAEPYMSIVCSYRTPWVELPGEEQQ
ncbi:hypothetical protein [Mycolicibacterium sp. XJ1819]